MGVGAEVRGVETIFIIRVINVGLGSVLGLLLPAL